MGVYRDYETRAPTVGADPPDGLAPAWLQRPAGQAWLGAFGDLKDWLATGAIEAVKARLAGTVAGVTRRTNLLLRSQELEHAAWTKNSSTVTANAAAAPDGTTTADRVNGAAATGEHYFEQANSDVTDGQVGCLSVHALAGNRTWLFLGMVLRDGSNVRGAFFDLASGSVGFVDAGYTASMSQQPGGWYRCYVSGSVGTGASAPRGRVQLSTGNGVKVFTDDGTGWGWWAWGAQLEKAAAPTTYIPTGAAAVTVEDFVPLAPADALPLLGAERLLQRGIAETEGAFRQRIQSAWSLWQYGGTAYGLLTALVTAGYPTPIIQAQNGVQYRLDASGNLVTTSLASPSIGALRSDFGVIIAKPWPDRWGGSPPADGSSEQKTVASLIGAWKPAHCRCVALVVQNGNVWGGGLTWGQASLKWGGGSNTTWTPPAG